jgi:hypothetical protein
MTVLGFPPLWGIYLGSAILLRGAWLGRPVAVALRHAEVVTAFATALMAPFAVAALAVRICIYA